MAVAVLEAILQQKGVSFGMNDDRLKSQLDGNWCCVGRTADFNLVQTSSI
jgi:hypothetical protein